MQIKINIDEAVVRGLTAHTENPEIIYNNLIGMVKSEIIKFIKNVIKIDSSKDPDTQNLSLEEQIKSNEFKIKDMNRNLSVLWKHTFKGKTPVSNCASKSFMKLNKKNIEEITRLHLTSKEVQTLKKVLHFHQDHIREYSKQYTLDYEIEMRDFIAKMIGLN